MSEVKRGVLYPLQVPWRISQGASGFHVEFWEQEALHVSVFAYDIDQIAEDTPQNDQRVMLTFGWPAYVKLGSAIGINESVDLGRYAYWYDIDSDLHQHICDSDSLHREWKSSGICPDPWAYTVSHSQLLKELNLTSEGSVEYLLVGDDWSVNIVAREVEWAWKT